MKVLLVSDDVVLASKLHPVLKAAGTVRECVLVQSASVISEAAADLQSFQMAFLVLNEDFETARLDLKAIRSMLQCCVVVVGAVDSPETVIDLLHCGADDFLDTRREISVQITKILENTKSRFGLEQEQRNCVVFVGSSGGAGVSSLAVNCAASFVLAGKPTCLFDMVVERSDLELLLGLKPAHTLRDLCRNGSEIDHNMVERSLTRHSSGLRVLAAGRRRNPLMDAEVMSLRRIETLSRESFLNTVFDLGTLHEISLHLDLVNRCHSIVIPFRLDFPSLCNVRSLIELLESHGIDSKKVVPVANRVGRRVEIPAEQAERILGQPIGHLIPEDDGLSNLCANCGIPIVIEAPKSRLARSIRDLSHLLLDRRGSGTMPNPDQLEKTIAGPHVKGLQFLKQMCGCFSL